MADLLGVTNPVPGYEKNTINRNITTSPDSSHVQNVPNPNRVVRPDGRTEQQNSGLFDHSGKIRYDSNFNTFIQRLKEAPNLATSLSKLLVGQEGTVVHSGMSEGIAEEMSQVLQMLRMDQAQLLAFITDQFKEGTRFGGPLFALLRNAYANAASGNVRMDILQFLKSYIDYSSTSHIEENLLRNLYGMADSMPASWAEKLRTLAAQLENGIAAGDRQGNLEVLQREVFPHMSAYVGQTHDMGTARGLLTMLALDLVRYENGSEENLLQSFHQLRGYGTLKSQLGAIDDQTLLKLLERNRFADASPANQFADHLTAAAARALRGEGSAETQEVFRQLVSAMLLNQSVYMPLNHYLLPLEWNGKMLFSELWVDPNAENEKNKDGDRRGNITKFLFKIDVQSLGLFDVILAHRDHEVEMLIACPDTVAPFTKQIQQAITGILEHNGLTSTGVTVRKMERPLTLTEVFPKIFEGRNSVNVKV